MNETKLPDNYEIREPHDATHVWITGRGILCKIHTTPDLVVRAEVPTGGSIQFAYPALHLLKLTTDFVYCRERPAFREVMDGCTILALELDGPYRTMTILIPNDVLEYDDIAGNIYRVTIEEVLPE